MSRRRHTGCLLVQEKDMVMQEYLSLKEANKQLKEQAHHHPSLSFLPLSFVN